MATVRQLRVGERKEAAKPEQKIVGERGIEELLKLTKSLGAEAVARSLTTDEFESAMKAAKLYKDQNVLAKRNYDALRSVLHEYAKLKNQREIPGPDGLLLKAKGSSSYRIEPIIVAQHILGLGLTKKATREMFNRMFSVNLGEARKEFGENVLDGLGGKYETDNFSNVDIK